jgi:hypothetical protein
MFDENDLTSDFFENFESFEQNLRNLRFNIVNDETLDSKQKIIKSLEIEYEYLQNQIKALIYSNDEMSKFDVNDNLIIESRSENLKFMQKYIIRLNKIRNEIAILDPCHHIVEIKNTLQEINEEYNIEIQKVNSNDENSRESKNKNDLNDKVNNRPDIVSDDKNVIINEINL